jgi:hypothetical protein
MVPPFSLNYWGKLTQLHIPRAIGQQDRLILGASAIAVLAILNREAKASLHNPNLVQVEAKITIKTLKQMLSTVHLEARLSRGQLQRSLCCINESQAGQFRPLPGLVKSSLKRSLNSTRKPGCCR